MSSTFAEAVQVATIEKGLQSTEVLFTINELLLLY